ncbi:sensor histidine kinase [Paenibacillus apiarius]|uniref:histidine kinase n=1 Tax=Paenibacillus apiarius TaxID=46240 RepID=A0ABT4E129_9BACL|nr:sensor histidine kinase [Paenibacillus apiarius]MCY9517801.1 sensor histidine kinase [Paenibacillus apiarius]MCY9523313.1 sensor histidine kinase [Paenibacillus apiarius]MCY9553094.1 sensor histidine kinase [Paenibacillus apiarius]MCY9561588.1 sensor histidine kinase [Paenibacillus apiarius]MCY9687115.1 sensor histidine kinase [Paenibacillus apiarius]
MKGSPVILFLRDRLSYLIVCGIIIGLGAGLMMLEHAHYPQMINTGTITYFVALALLFTCLWLVIEYIRQKAYYRELKHAIEMTGDLHAAATVQSIATEEQQLVARVLEQQHSAYLNELGTYRRQQELHNHFVLQWVHQMKTPVSVIDMLVQEALQQLPLTKDEQKRFMVSMQDEADRMMRSLEMLLYTARLDKFEMDLHIRSIPIHDLIRSVINAHKRLCIRHSIFPQMEGEAWAETDEKWMRVVLNQFVSNAIKYSKSKAGAKQLVFRVEPNGDGSGKLSVTDEGCGIAPYEMPRIFDPFFTGENGRTAGESTGMGLYLAKQICNRLGHVLSAESELGAGTTMTVTFNPGGIHILGSKADMDKRAK